MKACIVPPNPGNLSAFGLLAVDWRTDHIVTKVMHEDAIDLPVVAARYAALEHDAVATLERDGIARARSRSCARPMSATPGSRWKSASPRAPAPIDGDFIADLVDAFHAAHLKTFGYNYAGRQKVELVNFCVSGFGMIDRPRIPKVERTAGDPPKGGSRPVYFEGKFRDTPVYDRAALGAGRSSPARRSSRSSAPRPSSFPARGSASMRTAFWS